MEERFVFSVNNTQQLFDKSNIIQHIQRKKQEKSNEGNTITLLIMGHGREKYKEVFEKTMDKYSEPFAFVVNKQKTKNTVRILSKAGKPKTCAWDYSLCSKTHSSQDIILQLSHLFFDDDTKNNDTLSIMIALSSYFKTVYPRIIEKISRNYQDHPDDKNQGSPDAFNYEERYTQFSRVLDSLEEHKFSQLKALSHEKVFTIRPENKEVYEEPCEKYHMEIVDVRMINEETPIHAFIMQHLNIQRNMVENYYNMNEDQIQTYIGAFNNAINDVYSLPTDDYEKYFIIKFVYKIFFGQEILLSEIIEIFTIFDFDTINIIDNTCRVQDDTHEKQIKTPRTSEIEEREKFTLKNGSKNGSKNGGTRKLKLK